MCGWFAGTLCRDFRRTLLIFGTHHCCNSSSSCIFETREHTPASAGAERRNFDTKRAVCTLRSASDVACPAVTWQILPTIASTLQQIRGDAAGSFQTSTVGCRQGDDNVN